MDEETAHRAFEPFFTTKRFDGEPSPTGAGGVGLGLAICQQIVRNHHGEIEVRSVHGKGTRFRIIFPLQSGKQVHQQ
jgi:signal transduction histidine kinase